jgi:hypothetical protein
VVVLAYGGWDTRYAVDPAPDLPGGPSGRAVDFAGVEAWVDDSRPSVERFFARTRGAVRMARGVDVGSVSHGVCLRAVLGGRHQREVPDIGARVAAGIGDDAPLPCLNLGSVGQPGHLAPFVGRSGPSNQLAALLSPEGTAYAPELTLDPWEAAEVARLVDDRAANAPVPDDRIRDFLDSHWRAEAMALRADALGASTLAVPWEMRAEQAGDALRRGLSRVVMLDAGLDFDTHQGNDAQGPLHEQLFAQLDVLLDALEGGPARGANVLDDTVVMVVSEMSRSPVRNAAGGTDHWPVATYLFCGGPFHGTRVVGSTGADRRASTDPAISPGAVLGTVMAWFGLDNPYDDEVLHALV